MRLRPLRRTSPARAQRHAIHRRSADVHEVLRAAATPAGPDQPRPLDQRAARRPAPDVPPAARDRLAAALIPLFGSDAVVWTTDIAQLPRDQAIELLAWMAQALTAATLNGW